MRIAAASTSKSSTMARATASRVASRERLVLGPVRRWVGGQVREKGEAAAARGAERELEESLRRLRMSAGETARDRVEEPFSFPQVDRHLAACRQLRDPVHRRLERVRE